MSESEPNRGTRYKAFVSYSHKDAAAARRLHRRLETYRVPGRLVGTQGLHGPVPARLTPIFRDREELPAAGDLSETVRAALAESENLIVICSPDAAASPWVGREIAFFRELHPGRPVYAAIAAGEPSEAFPPELLAGGTVEPLAADLRGEGDGRRLGFLKLAAGLAGVGLDALVQRDAQRRMRRVMAVTAAAVAAMLVMAILTTMALTARAEAERQRAEAEGLVEFMLTDVRRDLRKVGRLDIMAVVNQRALAFYEAQHASGPPATAIRARVDQTMGEDLLTRGDTRGALRHFNRAHAITSQLVKSSASDPKIIFVHAQSEYWVGRAYELQQEWRIAERQYTRFAAATDRLIASAPGNPDYMMQVGWAAVDLGNVQLKGIRDFKAAELAYSKAVKWFAQASAARPNDTRAILAQANAYGWLADSYFARTMWPQSLKARSAQHGLMERLHRRDPNNVESRFRLALAKRGLSQSHVKAGQVERARPLAFQAHDSARRLVEHDPQNAEWLLFSALASCDLYFGKVGVPEGLTKRGLGDTIVQAAAVLTAQGNPRVSEFKNCVEALKQTEG